VITRGQLNKESFSSLVIDPSTNLLGFNSSLQLRSYQAMKPLLNLSESDQTTGHWLFYPQTRTESIVGCGLVYSAVRHRSMSGQWAMSGYCTSAWIEYASSTNSDEDWIQYLNRRNGPLVEPTSSPLEEKPYGSTESIFGGK
jgi:hypothetical protein